MIFLHGTAAVEPLQSLKHPATASKTMLRPQRALRMPWPCAELAQSCAIVYVLAPRCIARALGSFFAGFCTSCIATCMRMLCRQPADTLQVCRLFWLLYCTVLPPVDLQTQLVSHAYELVLLAWPRPKKGWSYRVPLRGQRRRVHAVLCLLGPCRNQVCKRLCSVGLLRSPSATWTCP